ncbi:MinD/ParA family protein [Mycobacterium palustre]|uniref:ATPase n=1 Tax=Mycobacterium palustre TaxID=153971 RepID=A0A1X1ZGF7_9MYCO|nr:MinD/ParA family protein [Mycobacterium palustre]MCV7099468.1 MinD/ParA family protein [Mycobacterium palustre]ORW22406.1 ATPase [Mycobacterium palustre]
MSEHPTSGVGAPDQQTAQLPPQQAPAEPQPEPKPEPSPEAPTRAFAGFRTERRPSPPPAGPRPAGMPPWDPTPVTGIPRVDPTAFGAYYNGPAEAPPAPAPAPYRPEPVPHTPYPELSTGMLLRPVKPPPSEGWRRWLYEVSGHLINLGESPRAAHHNNLVAQVNRPLRGCYRIALLSLKGGVGKTTVTATLGSTFASIRGDRVVAVDANPDRGTLSQKIPLETSATVRQLLHDAGAIERYSDVRRYTSKGPSGLEVLASENDPASSEPFSADDYARTLEVLERFYGLVLTDCGPGLLHSVMSSVLQKADLLVVISSASIDGARSASQTLDWLDAHGHEDLVRNSVAVINAVRSRTGKVDMNKVIDHFSRRCRAVRLIPFDPHLEEGAEIDLDRLKRPTREALTELAAVVADGFPGDQRNPGVV